MRLVIESTETVTELDGVEVRLWEGTTETGRPVKVFVRRIAADDPAAQAELERELRESDEPGEMRASRVIPLRMIL